jgi:Common central domain of tyrosinase
MYIPAILVSQFQLATKTYRFSWFFCEYFPSVLINISTRHCTKSKPFNLTGVGNVIVAHRKMRMCSIQKLLVVMVRRQVRTVLLMGLLMVRMDHSDQVYQFSKMARLDVLALITNYDRFANTAGGSGLNGFAADLENGPHQIVHGLIGGHMTSDYSPADPIFWLHHSNVDRVRLSLCGCMCVKCV